MIRPFLLVALALPLVAYAFWVYGRMELPVRGGRWLASMRAASLLLLLLLLFDVRIPDAAVGGAPRWVVLDASLSMDAAEGAPWQAAVERARRLEGEGWRVVPLGEASGAGDGLPEAPGGARTLLGPVLERAAEAGAGEVLVISDMRLEDPVQVEAALSALPVQVRFHAVPSPGPNAGISSFRIPDASSPDEPLEAAVEVHGEGADSALLEIREEGRLVASRSVALPSPGAVAPLEVELPPTAEEGRVRYTATVTVEGDVFGEDDEAVLHVNVGHESGALVFVSLRPDWEPRYLVPVLEQVTGLPTAAFLRAGPDRWVPMGPALERGAPRDSAAVRRAAAEAALLVVHGLDDDADSWVPPVLDAGDRVLVFPAGPRGARLVGFETGGEQGGEWYVSSEIPPSPMTGSLAGTSFEGLPPLSGLLAIAPETPGTVPLRARLRGAGQGAPAMVLLEEGGSRLALATARGYWRWAARGGAGRDAYRSLWSGVAGWLLEAEGGGSGTEAAPVRRVVPRGESVTFSVPAGDTVRLRVTGADSATVADTTLAGGVHSLGTLAPGLYRYRAEGSGSAREGRFDVEARVGEMAVPVQDPQGTGDGAGAAVQRDVGTPLRIMPWPYLLLLGLLCAEWVARRRVGLR